MNKFVMASAVSRSSARADDPNQLSRSSQPSPQQQQTAGRSSSSSSIISDSYIQDNARIYGTSDDRRREGSLSPSGSISSIHDAYYLNDRIRCLESEKLALMIDHNNLIREFNKRMESHLEEIRNLKETNHHIDQEATELRDLCCFLDDDRQKCRKLAKEWQRFGKHTVAVMRTEVMSYQEKLRSLENRQTELIKENGELRDLCVYLDNQRTGTAGEVDPSMMKYSICRNCSELKKDDGKTGDQNGHAEEQVAHLQNQILQLEKEKDTLHKLLMYGGQRRKDKKRVSFSTPDDDDSSSTASEVDRMDYPPQFGSMDSLPRNYDGYQNALRHGLVPNALPIQNHSKKGNISPRNSGLTRVDAKFTDDQLHEAREKLIKSQSGDATLSEHEISLLKDMCNVATEKQRTYSLESSSLNNSFDQSPLSPPPSSLGLPLYSTQRRSSDLHMDGGSDLSSIVERRENETERQINNPVEYCQKEAEKRESLDDLQSNEAYVPVNQQEVEEVVNNGINETENKGSHLVNMDDIDELIAGINKDIAGSLQQLNIEEHYTTKEKNTTTFS